MNKVILLLIFILFLPLTSYAEWSRSDKLLMGSYIALSALDVVQTSQFAKRGIVEVNPLFRKGDGSPDVSRLIIMKLLVGAGVFYFADRYPNLRTELLLGVNSMQGGVVIWNMYQW
jgi:hypothetical protein